MRIRLGVQSLASQKLGMMAYVWNLSIWEVEAGESEVQDPPWLGNEFEASLDYLRLCLKAKAKSKTKQNKTKQKNNLCEVFVYSIFSYCCFSQMGSLYRPD